MIVPSICYTKISNKWAQISTYKLEQFTVQWSLFTKMLQFSNFRSKHLWKNNASDVGHKHRYVSMLQCIHMYYNYTCTIKSTKWECVRQNKKYLELPGKFISMQDVCELWLPICSNATIPVQHNHGQVTWFASKWSRLDCLIT